MFSPFCAYFDAIQGHLGFRTQFRDYRCAKSQKKKCKGSAKGRFWSEAPQAPGCFSAGADADALDINLCPWGINATYYASAACWRICNCFQHLFQLPEDNLISSNIIYLVCIYGQKCCMLLYGCMTSSNRQVLRYHRYQYHRYHRYQVAHLSDHPQKSRRAISRREFHNVVPSSASRNSRLNPRLKGKSRVAVATPSRFSHFASRNSHYDPLCGESVWVRPLVMISLLIGSIQLVCRRTKCLKQIVLPRPVGVRGTLLDMLSSNFKVREQLVGASESMFLLLVGTNGGNTEGMVYDSK